MKPWPDDLKLLAILTATRELVARSNEDGWGDEHPEEIGKNLDQIIEALLSKDISRLPEYWDLLYAPTGPLQEIAMANGWVDHYSRLAREYDSLEFVLKKK